MASKTDEDMVIDAKKLCLTFDANDGPVHALKDVDLGIQKGDFVSFIGPSGCGKTTLLRVIADLEHPTSGSITVNGMTPEQARLERAYGYVFQAPALLAWRTIERNVGLPLEIMGLSAAEKAERVARTLDLVGLDGFGRKFPWQLSGGMQQRVALARCLVNDPDLILMDEPLGALDALTREKMQSLILELWKKTGKTIIVITHSVEEALLLGERLFVMAPRPGRIHREYRLPFAEMGLTQSLRQIKQEKEFSKIREEILTMIWDMEEEIMGNV